ncbi:MAG: N-acetylmuramoyl-L-alanine amidase [Acidobacteriota bacterium]
MVKNQLLAGFVVAFGLLGLFSPAPAQAAADYVLEHDGRSLTNPVTRLRRKDYLPVEDLGRFLGFRIEKLDRKSLLLIHDAGQIRLQAGRPLVTVDGQPVILGDPILLRRRRLYAPVELITRGLARVLQVEARHDRTQRLIRIDSRGKAVNCERLSDRTRVLVQLDRSADFSGVLRDGRRRILELTNQELPAQVGGCLFDDRLADLEVAPTAGRTRLTFYVGPRFANLKVYELPEARQLVLDFFDDGAVEEELVEVTPVREALPGEIFETVVLDPGHGGIDSGAVGPTGLKEKDLNLAIARSVAAMLRDSGLRVLLTRDTDVAVPLVARTELANRERADLFVSIHANATLGKVAYGAETYFLSLEATDEAARQLAAFENDATGLRERARAGGDPLDGDLELVLWDLAQQQYLAESSRLAEVVQRELNQLAGTKDRGVKQANFLVLRGATMPAILVEVGFLSTPAEERRMRTLGFQQATAAALYRAIVAFRDERRLRGLP